LIYKDIFSKATEIKCGPFDHQRRLAEQEELPQHHDVPTGCGKTAAVWLNMCTKEGFEYSVTQFTYGKGQVHGRGGMR